ncbi:MAG TPA: glutathione S-transferase family protein, partial [Candidatus Acidoferrales bacterium]|nr:glutathione S-transferase family protein [Candidatus Acidoferrales bacterium]
MLRLHWHPFSIVPRRVRIALQEKQVPYEEVLVDVLAGEQRGAEFRRLNPFGQIPVLEDGDLIISESVAILEYLEERFPAPRLLSVDAATRATTRQFMLWSGDYMSHSWEAWMAPAIRPDAPVDSDARDAAYDSFEYHLDVLERRLGRRDWLVDEYSLADICYAPLLTVFDRVGLGALVEARPAVAAWVQRLNARPAVSDTAPPMMRPTLP